jgi:hypothetical protein
MRQVGVEADLGEMFAQPRCVVFCHAEWSMPSVMARSAMQIWERERAAVPVYVINIDDAPAQAWLRNIGQKHLCISGSGEVLWLADGRLVGMWPFWRSAEEVTRRTVELLGEDAVRGSG